MRDRAPAAIGVHLEGPFLGGAPGAHPVELLRPVDLEWLLACCDRHEGLVRIVTLAPESDPELAATRALRARAASSSPSVTAPRPTPNRARAADAGARMVTHLFNGMGPLHHREPGLAGAALDDRRLVPSFIADLVHVHPAALRIALAARPDAVLVTDRVGGDLDVRDGAARLEDGTLAGSVVTMLESVQHLVSIGVPLGQAVRTATGNPARALGLTDRGRVAAGLSCRPRVAGSRVAQPAGTLAGRRSARLVSIAPSTTNTMPASDSAAMCSSRNTTPATTATTGTK